MKKLPVRSITDRIKNDPYYQIFHDLETCDNEEFYRRGLEKRIHPKGTDDSWTEMRRYLLSYQNRRRVNNRHAYESQYTILTEFFEFEIKINIEVTDYRPPCDIVQSMRILAGSRVIPKQYDCWHVDIPDDLDLLRSEDFALSQARKRFHTEGALSNIQHAFGMKKDRATWRLKEHIRSSIKREQARKKGYEIQDEQACLKSIARHLNIISPTLDFAIRKVHQLGRQQKPTRIYQADYTDVMNCDGDIEQMENLFWEAFEAGPDTIILP